MKSFPFPRFFGALRFVGAVTENQLVRWFYDGDYAAARADIAPAAAAGFITVEAHIIRPRSTLEPIAVLTPGKTPPCPEQVAYAASKLWSPSLQPELVIRGTVKLAAFCGGHHSVIPSAQLSHEVALSSVFFAKQQLDPGFEWNLITQSGPRGGRVDAVSSDGTLIELVGRYSGVKVGGKLALSAAIGATVELW